MRDSDARERLASNTVTTADYKIRMPTLNSSFKSNHYSETTPQQTSVTATLPWMRKKTLPVWYHSHLKATVTWPVTEAPSPLLLKGCYRDLQTSTQDFHVFLYRESGNKCPSPAKEHWDFKKLWSACMKSLLPSDKHLTQHVSPNRSLSVAAPTDGGHWHKATWWSQLLFQANVLCPSQLTAASKDRIEKTQPTRSHVDSFCTCRRKGDLSESLGTPNNQKTVGKYIIIVNDKNNRWRGYVHAGCKH